MEFTLHHIGVVCFNIDKTAKLYEILGYNICVKKYDPNQNVNVCLLINDKSPDIELITPPDPENDVNNSPITKILGKNGVSPYHICYAVTDINEAIKELKNKKFMNISPIKYSNIFNNNVTFLYHKDFGLIELIEITDKNYDTF